MINRHKILILTIMISSLYILLPFHKNLFSDDFYHFPLCLISFLQTFLCIHLSSPSLYIYLKMERQTPVRNWKYVHHNRKQSEDSLDNSIDSVQSSKSGKFNRFQFRKEEKPLSFLQERKEPIFTFTGKGRDRNNDRSILKEREHSLKDKESDTSKLSDNQLILKGLNNNNHKTERDVNRQDRDTSRVEKEPRQERQEGNILQGEALNNRQVRLILKQVKGVTEQFKKVIAHFAKKYKDMRYEWDRSFKALLTLQLNQETQVIIDLKSQLEKKQEELDQLSSRVSFEKYSHPLSAVKPVENNGKLPADSNSKPAFNSSFQKLAISKVQPTKDKETLSRTNTIADFLCAQAMVEREERPPGHQLRNLRQTIKRMQQILEE